jgi:hypothetical protein
MYPGDDDSTRLRHARAKKLIHMYLLSNAKLQVVLLTRYAYFLDEMRQRFDCLCM